MEDFTEAVVAVVVTMVLGIGVGGFMDWAVPEPTCPAAIEPEQWRALTERVGAGKGIGYLERLLILLAFWIGEHELVVAWFAFKVAAKWEAWTNIVQVPAALDSIPPLAWVQGRLQLGSWILSRFLVGTLINVLIAAVAAYLGRNSVEFVHWLCSLTLAA